MMSNAPTQADWRNAQDVIAEGLRKQALIAVSLRVPGGVLLGQHMAYMARIGRALTWQALGDLAPTEREGRPVDG